jgi:hypothetical protein
MSTIEWGPTTHYTERFLLLWKDEFEEQLGWVNGKLEFLLQHRPNGEIRLLKARRPEHEYLGIFQSDARAKEWALEYLTNERHGRSMLANWIERKTTELEVAGFDPR